jgi:hypothetical protein
VCVPTGDGTRREIPTGDADVLIVLLDCGHGWNRAAECQQAEFSS